MIGLLNSRSAVLFGLLAGLTIGGCTQTGSPPAATPGVVASNVTAPNFRLPEGAGCSGEIARTRAVIENDLSTGNVSRRVHDRFVTDLGPASSACAAGRDGEATQLVQATKVRFGYR